MLYLNSPKKYYVSEYDIKNIICTVIQKSLKLMKKNNQNVINASWIVRMKKLWQNTENQCSQKNTTLYNYNDVRTLRYDDNNIIILLL